MNYLREINAFYDWLETNPLSTSSIALWYALIHICNKTGWAAEFAVAVSVLCVKTGLSARAIYDARNELKIKGRLRWKSRNGNQSAIYGLQPLCATGADNTADKPVDKGADKPVDKTALLNKQNTNGVSNDTLDPPNEKPKKEPKPKKPKEPKPKEPVNSDHQRVMSHYHTSFQGKFGVKPVIFGGKDGETIKKLLVQKPADELIVLLNDFFESKDAFIQNSGYTLGAFLSQVNKLTTLRARPSTKTPEDSRKKEIIKKLYLT